MLMMTRSYLCHPIENHVDEHKSSRSTNSVTGDHHCVHDHYNVVFVSKMMVMMVVMIMLMIIVIITMIMMMIFMMIMMTPAMDDDRAGAASVWLVHFPDGHRLSHAQSWWWEQFLRSNVFIILLFFNHHYFTSAWMSSPWSSSVVICQLPDQVSKSLKYTNVLWESSLFIELEVRKGFRSKMLTFQSLWRGGWSRLVVGCLVEGG